MRLKMMKCEHGYAHIKNCFQCTKEVLTAAQARIEELERMVVWCARNGVWYGSNIMRGYLLHTLLLDEDGDLCGDDRIDCDGTPASILAAVEKAMGES